MAAVEASTMSTSGQIRRELFEFGVDRAVSTAGHPLSPPPVETVLRRLPSQGWIGRRDRALLVLSHMAGLSFEAMADLVVGNVTVRDGVATIKTLGGTTTLRINDDDMICGPCALARWLHALDMSVVYPSGRVSVAVIARSAPLTSHSPHLCQGTVTVTDSTRQLPLLPVVDQYGPLTDAALPLVVPTVSDVPAPAIGSISVLTRRQRPIRSTAGRIPTQRQAAIRTDSRRPADRNPLRVAEVDSDQWNRSVSERLQSRVRQLLEHRSGHDGQH